MKEPKQEIGKKDIWIKEDSLYLIIFLALIWAIAVRLPLDSDMWWHLRAGGETWANQSIYRVDTFSSTRLGTPWINHSWLSQVVMYLIYRLGGFPGLSIWVALCAVLSMGLVYFQMEGHPLVRGAVLLLAGALSSVVWSPRPQIFSLVLLALLSWLVSRFRVKRRWIHLGVLPVLFALWANLHAGYVLGLIYLGAMALGDFLDFYLLDRKRKRIQEGIWPWLLAAAVVSGLAALLNPFGLEIWKVPFNTVGVETLQNLIGEWASPDFHQAFQQPFLVMLLGLMALFAFSSRKATGKDLVPVVIFSWAALTARRNFGPFAIIAAPVLVKYAVDVGGAWLQEASQRYSWAAIILAAREKSYKEFNPRIRNVINLALVAAVGTAGVLKTIQVNQPALFRHYEEEIYPFRAVQWIQEKGLRGTLFNDYNWGGYLIFRLPEVPVFVDGRTDLFGDEILEDYQDLIWAKADWKGVADRYGIDLMLLRKDTPLVESALAQGWQIAYQDDLAVVLRKGGK